MEDQLQTLPNPNYRHLAETGTFQEPRPRPARGLFLLSTLRHQALMRSHRRWWTGGDILVADPSSVTSVFATAPDFSGDG